MYKLGLEMIIFVKFRELLVYGVIFALTFTSFTVSGQDIQYSVEIECQQNSVEVDSDPANIVGGTAICTVTNPSMHSEKISISVSSNSEDVGVDFSDSSISLDAESSEDFTVTITPTGPMWASNYQITVLAEVVEVNGVPPPSYQSDESNVDYTVVRYTDFIIDECTAQSLTFGETPAPLSLYCMVYSGSNFYDEYILKVTEDSKSSLEKYGFTFNERDYGDGIQVAEDYDGYVFYMIDDLFTIDQVTSEWTKVGGEYPSISFKSSIDIEVESVYSRTQGTPHMEYGKVDVDAAMAYDEEIHQEIVDEANNDESILASIGMMPTIVLVGIASVVKSRQTSRDED